jgi:hypothetical protein
MPEDKPLILDSGKYSYTVAECKHAARKMLPDILEVLSEIATNPTAKNSDRIHAADILRKFAEESEDEEQTVSTKLSPKVAKLLAKMGQKNEQTRGRNESKENALPATGRVVPAEKGKERLPNRETD